MSENHVRARARGQAERWPAASVALAKPGGPRNLSGMRIAVLALLGMVFPMMSPAQDSPADPYLWLEDVSGAKALDWVRAQDAAARGRLESSPDFSPIRARLLSIYDSKDKIPYVEKEGAYYYNFWQDAQHVRGLWRRTTPAEYLRKDPAWETVIDLDALSAAEKESWVWKGAQFCYPERDRGLVSLSRGGGDAVVVREFDLVSKSFVRDGFALPEAKSQLAWRTRDSI